MAVGRITGPLLKSNLLRNGVNLAFETNLLYLDVVNGRVGIKTTSPAYDLDINGTTRTSNLTVTTQADLASFTISGNTISSTNSQINLTPNGVSPVVYQGTIVTGNLQLSTNTIATTGTNTDLNITTTGTGVVNVNSNMLVNGNLHATGNITADGNITFGNAPTDTVTFAAEVASNIIPDGNNTRNLGSNSLKWANTYTNNVLATSITASTITGNGINLTLPQGNIFYVATNGSDSNAGVHENNPFATIKYALSQATSGTTVYIYAGTYTEIFPMTIPAGVTVKGAGIRAVNVQPTAGTISNDAFLLNGQTTVEDLSITGFRFNAGANTGYGFKLANNFVTTSRSPYIRNISILTKGSVTSGSDPFGFNQGDAGGGAYFDGSVALTTGVEVAVLFHSVTMIVPARNAITATNGVRIEWLNCFSYFANYGIYLTSGSSGIGGAGLTRLEINTKLGTWNVGNTVTSYASDGTTVLATGTIASIVGNYVNLTGKCTGFQSITNRTGKTVIAHGSAQISTAQQKYGQSSLLLNGTTDYVTVTTNQDFAFGTGAWTIEMWVYRAGGSGANQILADFRPSNPTVTPVLYLNTTYVPTFLVNGVNVITGGSAFPLNTWTHVAVSKSGTSTKMFVNGTQSGSTYTDNNNYIQGPLYIGSNFSAGSLFNGYIDDVRIEKGVAKYTSNFTAPVSALTPDSNTVLLLNFNGVNTSTSFIDNGFTQQDIRTNAGGTASIINFANYNDFGSEFRSIGSAMIYGNYGVYGNGDGITAYLISTNFAYVGSGSVITNDPTLQIIANQITKLNGANIYYTSVDNVGNFNVGDYFNVNQKTGNVTFNGQSLNITSLSGVTFTDGTNTTTILPTEIDTGNIKISGNDISSIAGPINITASSNQINLQNNTTVTGNLTVSSTTTLQGNTTLGTTSSNTVNFVAGINSNFVPSTNNTYNLGTGSYRWANAYLTAADINGLTISNNIITTTATNADLQLQANGVGRVYIPNNNVQIDQSLTVTNNLTVTSGTTSLKATGITGTVTQTGNFNQTGNFTTSGNTQVTGNIITTGYLQLPQVTISGNTVSTTVTNADLNLIPNGTGSVVMDGIKITNNNIQAVNSNSSVVLTPQGTGSVVINSNQSLVLPIGSTSQQPTSPTVGMIRYNNTLNRYEGWSGSYWTQLSGVIDISGNTRITAELTPGANDNTIRFYTAGTLSATLDSSKLYTPVVNTDNITISNNTITTLVSGSNINLATPGSGSVVIGNLAVKNNSITNTVSGAVMQFIQSGTGYVKIGGTGGFVIPVGDTVNNRPQVTEAGMMRFNTDLQIVEVFSGTSWTSVAGTSGGVSTNTATDISITNALLFG